ncbi:MAG: sigma-70 family RNA polymerase sigma factor [Marmoricola sp.]
MSNLLELSPFDCEQQTNTLLQEAWAAPPDEAEVLRNRAVQLNLDMARGLATRYMGRGIPADDLIQVASLGLVQAARRFDPTRGSRFADFAVPTIRGELRKHFRDAGWVVRPPRRIQELQASIWGIEPDLIQELHRAPRPREIADRLGVELDDVVEALALDGCFAPSSLDTPVGPDARPAMDTLAGNDDDLASAEARVMLGPLVKALKPRDRRIVELRYFEGLTQREIGAALGVTQMQVSRLLSRILRDLRSAMEGADIEG